MGTVIQKLTIIPKDAEGEYFGCAAHNLQKAYEDIQEVGDPIGIACTGDYFILQTKIGNVWDFAWALDTWPAFEEKYLLWDERTGMAVLTMVTEKHSSSYPPAVRIRAILDEDDHDQIKAIMENADAD